MRPVMRGDAALPRGMASVEHETPTALAAIIDYARSRFVELQIAIQPGLVVQADPADYRICIRDLLVAAIDRASSGVLVTAMRHADGTEITVLDDGTADARPGGGTPGVDAKSVPACGTLRTDYHPQRGTTVRLQLPQPDGFAWPSDTYEDDEIPAYATS
jgi:hypothetical protein